MGLADAFGAEEKFSMKFSQFYALVKEATKAELITNAVLCEVPYNHIKEMITGEKQITVNITKLLEIVDE